METRTGVVKDEERTMATIFEKLAQERQKALQRSEDIANKHHQKKVTLRAMFRDALSVYTQHFCETMTKIQYAGVPCEGSHLAPLDRLYVLTLRQPMDTLIRCSIRPPLSLVFNMGEGVQAEIGVYLLDYHPNGIVGDPNPICLLYWTRTDVSERNIQRIMTIPPDKVRLEGVRDQVDRALNLILTKGKNTFEPDIPE